MGEIISFLRTETEKREILIEDCLKLDLNSAGEVDPCILTAVLQSVHQVYSSVEKLRVNKPEWVMISSNRLYDTIRALIALGSLPESNMNVGLHREASDSVVSGYLYVFHLFQIHSHGLAHTLLEQTNYETAINRVFNSVHDDLASRRKFLDKVRDELSPNDKDDIKVGIDLAFDEMENYIKLMLKRRV
ncbi:hypothetical protein O3Q51_01330 [Cryomorphaceae bacterium 1068]|nr:hypothetical protein [Cryomorphaceae bacterium 1068]